MGLTLFSKLCLVQKILETRYRLKITYNVFVYCRSEWEITGVRPQLNEADTAKKATRPSASSDSGMDVLVLHAVLVMTVITLLNIEWPH